MKLAVEWIEDVERFAELEEAWDRVAASRRLPFLSHAWFAAWWAAFGANRRLSICTAWDDGELAGVFPLCAHGGRVACMENEHTPAFAPFARDSDALRVLLMETLARAPSLVVRRLLTADPAAQLLPGLSAAANRLTFVHCAAVSPYVSTRGSVDEYWRQLSGNARRDLRRCRRLLESLDGVEVRAITEPRSLDDELAAGLAVEGSGWKTQRGTAVLDCPAASTFYRELAARFAARGKLGLSMLSIEGRVLAFNFNLVDHDRVWGLKGGYDADFSRFAPGMLLILAEVERCFELGLESLELLGEEAPWKRKFTREGRAHCAVHAYARRPMPVLRYGCARVLYPRAKRIYRRVLSGRARG